MNYLENIGKRAKMAAKSLSVASSEAKNKALMIVGGERQGEITSLGQSDGTIPAYSFSIVPNKKFDFYHLYIY